MINTDAGESFQGTVDQHNGHGTCLCREIGQILQRSTCKENAIIADVIPLFPDFVQPAGCEEVNAYFNLLRRSLDHIADRTHGRHE